MKEFAQCMIGAVAIASAWSMWRLAETESLQAMAAGFALTLPAAIAAGVVVWVVMMMAKWESGA